ILAGVSKAFSNRFARMSGDGRQSLYTSCTSSGISIYGSAETSCMMSSIGNRGARSSGPNGSCVAGLSGGGGGAGRSGTRLYQEVGIRYSGNTYLVAMQSPLDSSGNRASTVQGKQRKSQTPFWRSVLGQRPRKYWTPSSLP